VAGTPDVRDRGARAPRAAAPPAGGLRALKPVVFVACLLPLARLVFYGFTDRLGANPVEFITRSTGTWTLVMLCATLAVTPIRRLSGWNAVLRVRRMLGLYTFFYACLHALTWVWFDRFFDPLDMLRDLLKRPFITVGMAAFLLLVPLAATSTQAMIRRLGRNWQALHRAIYAIAGLAMLHYWWMKAGKNDFAQPAIYGAVIVVLLAIRAVYALRRAASSRRRSSA
jgi:sulfoxide reductase heme-binding subunit YedZ